MKNIRISAITIFFPLLFISVNTSAGMKEVWSRSYPLEGESAEIGSDIKLDSIKDNIYISGLKCVQEGTNTRGIVAVRKIDLDGKELWKQVCDIGLGGVDQGSTVAVDDSGNVYVAGYKNIDRKGKNLWFRKYDPCGGIIWDKVFENRYDSFDAEFKEMAVDRDGNIYAAGYKFTDKLSRDLWLSRYMPDGTLAWKVILSHSTSAVEEDQGLALDRDGNVYAAFYGDGEDLSYNLTLRKYDKNGSLLMEKQYPEDKAKDRRVNRIAVDRTGNIYITGSEAFFYQGRNIFVVKFDGTGKELWTKTYTNAMYQKYTGNSLVIDRDQNVYVSATGGGDADDKKYSWISGLNKDGNEIWTLNYSGYAYGVKFSHQRDGSVYVLGTETGTNKISNIWIKKYVLSQQ